MIKYLIRACWGVLIACFIVKLLGGNYFEIACKNQHFIVFCGFIDKHFLLKSLLYAIICVVNISLLILAVIRQKKFIGKQYLIIPIIAIKSILSWRFKLISLLLDLIIGILIPFLISKDLKRVVLSQLIFIGFQAISLFIKNIGVTNLNDESAVISLIFNIDVSIMIFIYYLYSLKEKERKL